MSAAIFTKCQQPYKVIILAKSTFQSVNLLCTQKIQSVSQFGVPLCRYETVLKCQLH